MKYVFPTCGARAKRTGKPCKLDPVPGRTRCKYHGGKSTGPKTEAGKLASRENGKMGGRPRKHAPLVIEKKANPIEGAAIPENACRCRDCDNLSAAYSCLAAGRGEIEGGPGLKPSLGELRYCPAFRALPA